MSPKYCLWLSAAVWTPHRPVFLLTQSIKVILKSTQAFHCAACTGTVRQRAVEEDAYLLGFSFPNRRRDRPPLLAV